MSNTRMPKINAEIMRVLGEIITRKIKNPNITEMVNILRVETTSDLKHCKVFVSIFSTSVEKKDKTFKAILDSNKDIRRELAGAVNLRCVPELHFILDNSLEYSMHIDKVLKEINKSDE